MRHLPGLAPALAPGLGTGVTRGCSKRRSPARVRMRRRVRQRPFPAACPARGSAPCGAGVGRTPDMAGMHRGHRLSSATGKAAAAAQLAVCFGCSEQLVKKVVVLTLPRAHESTGTRLRDGTIPEPRQGGIPAQARAPSERPSAKAIGLPARTDNQRTDNQRKVGGCGGTRPAHTLMQNCSPFLQCHVCALKLP
eukprot:364937-Chlamydomonas_euryale.AAC.1